MNQQIASYEAKQAARAFTAAELQKANPHLVPNKDLPARVVAAKNIRIELKRAFPKTKFSVTTKAFSMGNSIDIRWTDGPTEKQVEEITSKYQSGDFDGMTDCYNYSQSAWKDAFGQGKYVHEYRRYSDIAIASCIRTVFNRYPANLEGAAVPSVEDFRMGRLYNVRVPGMNDSLQTFVNVELARRTWAIAKA